MSNVQASHLRIDTVPSNRFASVDWLTIPSSGSYLSLSLNLWAQGSPANQAPFGIPLSRNQPASHPSEHFDRAALRTLVTTHRTMDLPASLPPVGPNHLTPLRDLPKKDGSSTSPQGEYTPHSVSCFDYRWVGREQCEWIGRLGVVGCRGAPTQV
jgi:hypothetical protein